MDFSCVIFLIGMLLCYSLALPLVENVAKTSSLISHSTSKNQYVPDGCTKNEDCKSESMVCDDETGKCNCKELKLVVSPKGDCIPVKQLRESCSYNNQCLFFDKHAICSDGICECVRGYIVSRDRNGSSCERSNHVEFPTPTEVPHYRLDTNVIIIMVVMGVMFVGMCVALHLFSRARFRNRRTIFNSPHPRLMHIKLGGKRRASTISHRRPSHASVATPRSRRHSTSSHLSHPSPSPPGKIRTTSNGLLAIPDSYHEAPLAENESLPSTEDLSRKAHDDQIVQNGPAILKATAAVQHGTNSPTVIVTNTSGEKTLVKGKLPSPPAQV